MSQGDANPSVVQQLMFNRILAYVRLLSVDHVNVTGFDPKTGSIEGSLAGGELHRQRRFGREARPAQHLAVVP